MPPPLLPRRPLMLAAAAAAILPLHGRADAQPAASAIDGAWSDAARNREVPWRARWPAGAGACPLVLYSHGLGGSREGGDAWGEAWRAAGIAVLHLQHVGSDTAVLLGGLRRMRDAASATQLAARVLDMRFAMDELARRGAAGEGPWTRVRSDALGVAGHSFGAHTTQALAGQRFAVAADFADARPRAFIAFSPAPGRDGTLTPQAAFGAIERPFFAVTGSLDGDPFGSHATGEPRTLVHRGMPPGQRAMLWLEGADHMTFGGNAERRIRSGAWWTRLRATEEAESRHHALVAQFTTLWWHTHLSGEAGARQALLTSARLALGPADRFVWG